MKKNLITLAVLSAVSGTAAAQSSVTLFGIVDLGPKWVKNDGFGSRKSLASGNINTSRLGVRGVEDLGGGLRAAFWIEGAMTADDGTAAGQAWTRRSTVSLFGGFGELRLGRDYTPTFWNYVTFDPFGNNGVGALVNVARFGGGTGPNTSPQITFVRSSNSISYLLPNNLGGAYGQVTVAAGEGGAGKYFGGRVGFARGPFDVAASVGKQDVDAAGTIEYKTMNLAASWNFGFVKLMAQFSQQKRDAAADQKERLWLVGAAVPMGQGEIRASYVRSDQTTAPTNADASLIAVGYVYNLSKRTALYATGSRISNKGPQGFSVATGSSGTSSPGGPTAGGRSTGLEGGLRHAF